MQGMIGNNNNDLMEMNRSAIIKILQRREVCSRAEIARLTGLTQAAITKIIAALIEMGIVSEVGSIKGDRNRRSIGLKLNVDKYKIIGVKFSRHMFAVGVFDISGKMYTQMGNEYPLEENPETVLASLKRRIREVLEKYENVVAIGLAVPGPYLREEGRIAIVTQRPTWHNINFIEEFKEEFPVFIEHDAKAGALASWWFGEHPQPLHTLAYFLVGDGVGAGIIEQGNLQLGAQGTASEIGHISIDVHGPHCECGNHGCLELYCSAPAMLRLARQRMPECFPDKQMQNIEACNLVFEAARAGDARALEIVEEIAQYIGYGCVTLIYGYNPDIIVIGDIVSQGGSLLLPMIQKVVRKRVIEELYNRVEIKITSLTVDPTLYGAAAIATDNVLKAPSTFLAPKKQEI
ncbi:MAG: ROK family transcriptional regulator [Acetivibrio ethanolgignens]